MPTKNKGGTSKAKEAEGELDSSCYAAQDVSPTILKHKEPKTPARMVRCSVFVLDCLWAALDMSYFELGSLQNKYYKNMAHSAQNKLTCALFSKATTSTGSGASNRP
jgi:hypothetical protein